MRSPRGAGRTTGLATGVTSPGSVFVYSTTIRAPACWSAARKPKLSAAIMIIMMIRVRVSHCANVIRKLNPGRASKIMLLVPVVLRAHAPSQAGSSVSVPWRRRLAVAPARANDGTGGNLRTQVVDTIPNPQASHRDRNDRPGRALPPWSKSLVALPSSGPAGKRRYEV